MSEYTLPQAILAVAAVAAAIVAVTNLYFSTPTRSRLKLDLEIMKLLPETDPARRMVQLQVQQQLYALYSPGFWYSAWVRAWTIPWSVFWPRVLPKIVMGLLTLAVATLLLLSGKWIVGGASVLVAFIYALNFAMNVFANSEPSDYERYAGISWGSDDEGRRALRRIDDRPRG